MTITNEHTTVASAWTVLLDGMQCDIVHAAAQLGDAHRAAITEKRLDLSRTKRRIIEALNTSGITWTDTPLALELPETTNRTWPGGDLAFACAALQAADLIPPQRLADTLLLGELTDRGGIAPVRGVLPALLAARDAGLRRAIVPHASTAAELSVSDIEILRAASLADVIGWLRGDDARLAWPELDPAQREVHHVHDDGLVGQPEARWVAEIAASGGHHFMVMGYPEELAGSVARYLRRLLPELSRQEALDVAVIHSLAERRSPRSPLDTQRPLLTAHCPDCAVELRGGCQPGTVSLAHNGVLVLESASLGSSAVESLRHVLQAREDRLVVRESNITYPAGLQLVVTAPQCRRHDTDGLAPWSTWRHLPGMTAGLLDLIPLRMIMRLQPVDDDPTLEPIAVVRERVQRVRHEAVQRWSSHGAWTNATVPANVLHNLEFRLPARDTAELTRRVNQGALTPAGADEVIRVAWTLAGQRGDQPPTSDDIATAITLCGGHTAETLARVLR